MIKKTASILLIAALSLPSLPAFANKDLDDVRSDVDKSGGWRLAKHDKRHEIKAYVKKAKIEPYLSPKALSTQVAYHLLGRLILFKAKALMPICSACAV